MSVICNEMQSIENKEKGKFIAP